MERPLVDAPLVNIDIEELESKTAPTAPVIFDDGG
jgi:hypothetical protein